MEQTRLNLQGGKENQVERNHPIALTRPDGVEGGKRLSDTFKTCRGKEPHLISEADGDNPAVEEGCQEPVGTTEPTVQADRYKVSLPVTWPPKKQSVPFVEKVEEARQCLDKITLGLGLGLSQGPNL